MAPGEDRILAGLGFCGAGRDHPDTPACFRKPKWQLHVDDQLVGLACSGHLLAVAGRVCAEGSAVLSRSAVT